MLYKISSPKANHLRIIFELPASLWADQVFLVGDFNRWNPVTTPLQQDRHGVWRTFLDLPAETSYEFCYLIDGRFHSEAHADGWSAPARGLPNSVVTTTMTPSLPTTTAGGQRSTSARTLLG